ncbi:hypothetical protein SDJN03_29976, partial [Cucurbita argyrosperma subsp. sororia]
MKASSLQGMVKPPVGWLNPNSSSALLSKFTNEGWFNLEVTSMKASSLQEMVNPPVGWLNPNSSSALLSKSKNEGWNITNEFIEGVFFVRNCEAPPEDDGNQTLLLRGLAVAGMMGGLSTWTYLHFNLDLTRDSLHRARYPLQLPIHLSPYCRTFVKAVAHRAPRQQKLSSFFHMEVC